MKFIPPIHIIKNFLSQEEISKIQLDVFENRNYWRSATEYPTFFEKKNNFCNYKNILEDLLLKIKKYNIDQSDNNSIKFAIELIRQYYNRNNLQDKDQYFTNYINDDSFMHFIIKEVVKSLNSTDSINDKNIEDIYDNFFIADRFQFMLGDAIYLIGGKLNYIDWETQKIIREKFYWIYERLIDNFKNLFLEDVNLHSSLPSPGFHIFSLFDLCDEHEIGYGYHEDVSILDYHPNIDTNTIYSFAFLVKSPNFKPFVEFENSKIYYDYGNLYIWKGTVTHRIGKTILKSGEYRITFQGHLFFDNKEKIIKLFF